MLSRSRRDSLPPAFPTTMSSPSPPSLDSVVLSVSRPTPTSLTSNLVALVPPRDTYPFHSNTDHGPSERRAQAAYGNHFDLLPHSDPCNRRFLSANWSFRDPKIRWNNVHKPVANANKRKTLKPSPCSRAAHFFHSPSFHFYT